MSKSNLLIGADPELFILNTKTENFVSSHDLIPGTKENPFPVDRGAIQVDGVSAEFNIHPVENPVEFVFNIRRVMEQMQGMLPAELILKAVPTATFDVEYFESLPPEPKALGCMPDFSAWTAEQNIPPETDQPFRTGSGHVHIGYTEYEDPFNPEHFHDCCDLVKQLDSILYPMSLMWDSDDQRRSLYGKLGAFRPKHYGLEYRCLSNSWLQSRDLQEYVFIATKKAVEDFFKDIRYIRAPKCEFLCTSLLEGFTPKRRQLLEYHNFMVNMFNIPALPESVLDA